MRVCALRHTTLFSLLLSLLVLSALLVSAQPPEEHPSAEASERELRPDPESPITLPNLRVRIVKDPKRGDVLKAEGWGSHGHGEPGLDAYTIIVDEKRGTYKVIPEDPATIEPPEWRLKPQSHHGPFPAKPLLSHSGRVKTLAFQAKALARAPRSRKLEA